MNDKQVITPTGDTCFRCEEPILPGERARPILVYTGEDGLHERRQHEECTIRSVVGSVGHLLGKCSCRGGSEEDPPGMTRRQAAKAACALWYKQHVLR